ncbi:hypothetical protein [Bartonella sp. CB175]|uniref:hypothetical protein n=1 Tax=Bartonella sp. CB175 TaxID=3112256 RepID=UPI00300DF0C8
MEKRELKIFSISILGVCSILTGCSLSAPTYGTGRAVSIQFLRDIANAVSLRSKNNHDQFVMKSHPKLVLPKLGSHITLPQPQKDVTGYRVFSGTATRRRYLRNSRVSVVSKKSLSVNEYTGNNDPKGFVRLNAKHRQEYLRLQKERSVKKKSFLIEPPLNYRQPARTAPIGQRGKDEALKERERKSAAKRGL